MKINGKYILFALFLAALATICKFFFGPQLEWSGFSPVIAIALFAGMMTREKNVSFLLPLIALVLSDVAIQVLYTQGLFDYAGFYKGQWINYLLLLSCTLIGWLVKGKNLGSLLAGSLASPTLYFLLSNLLVWMGSQATYTKDFSGLMTCYTAGLPFYKNSLIATLVFLPGILFVYNYFVRGKARFTLAR